jgi:ferredoxin
MKVVVDWNLCESNGLCMDACPDVFRLDDADRLLILIERPDEGLRTQVEQAVRVCPRQALSLED